MCVGLFVEVKRTSESKKFLNLPQKFSIRNQYRRIEWWCQMFEIRFSFFSTKEGSEDRILEIRKGLPKGFGVEESIGAIRFSKFVFHFSPPRKGLRTESLKFVRVYQGPSPRKFFHAVRHGAIWAISGAVRCAVDLSVFRGARRGVKWTVRGTVRCKMICSRRGATLRGTRSKVYLFSYQIHFQSLVTSTLLFKHFSK